MKAALATYFLIGMSTLTAQGPVEQEPDHHAVFHNEELYILEPLFPPGHSTREHQHRYDGASVCIEGSIMRAKSAGGEWGEPRQLCQPGGVNVNEATGKPNIHTVENVGTVTTHLTLVENLRDGGWTSFDPIAAKGLKLLKESRAFRAYNVEPGSEAHTHPVATVAVLISGEAYAAGTKLVRAGAAVYIPAGQQHQITGPGKVVEVEVR